MEQDDIQDIIDILNQEENQEQEVLDSKSSLLTGKDAELLRKREDEYRDPQKHWVRRSVWLKCAQDILKQKRKRGFNEGLRYLTLPAYHRLDVSLFVKENLLEVVRTKDQVPQEVYVAAFENDPTKFGLMQDQIPSFRLFGCGDIQDALTDEGNKYYSDLRKLFPFDVINLDLTTSLTPEHEGPYSKTMEAIETVLDLQSGYGIDWAMFLTFRNVPEDLERAARQQLFDNLQSNLKSHVTVREAFQTRYRLNTVAELATDNEEICISQSIAKWLVDRAHYHKFRVKAIRPYYYARRNKGLPSYDIYKLVMELSPAPLNKADIPMKDIPFQAWMEKDLERCIDQHRCVDVEDVTLKLMVNAPDKFKEIEDEIATLSYRERTQ